LTDKQQYEKSLNLKKKKNRAKNTLYFSKQQTIYNQHNKKKTAMKRDEKQAKTE
jgi:hypothetical protein